MRNKIVNYKQLPTGVHVTIDSKGKVEVYTPREWEHRNWWSNVVKKYFKFNL